MMMMNGCICVMVMTRKRFLWMTKFVPGEADIIVPAASYRCEMGDVERRVGWAWMNQ